MTPLLEGLFGDAETAAALAAEAEIAAMIRVEIALAQAQSQLSVIPSGAGPALERACAGLRIAPGTLRAAAARDGVAVPALVAALRTALAPLPEAQYLHWGATSQDIMDTGLALRLRDLLALWQGRLERILARLAALALEHADLPMAARTYGQAATPTGFGAVVAGWGRPLAALHADLDVLRPRLLRVSLSGAAGTLSAMGPQGPQVRAGLAQRLDLADPGHGWHSDRAGPGALADWIGGLATALGKMAEDLLLMTQTGLSILCLEGGGGSSTMPQKQNPVGPSALAALSRHALGLAATLKAAGLHRQQRDGAAWFTEWLTLPPLAEAAGASLMRAGEVLSGLAPDPRAMAAELEAGHGLIHAEALSFALVRQTGLDRPAASAAIAGLCRRAQAEDRSLVALVAERWPGPDWSALLAATQLGQAPAEARAFHRQILGP